MVFMGRSRNRSRGGAIRASTRKEGGTHRDGSGDRDSRSSKSDDNRQFRSRERSRSPISKRPATERLGDQYPERSASELALQESLRITVGNDMFREQSHHSPLDDRLGSSLADRLGPPVNRSPLPPKSDRYGEKEYRGHLDDDTFYKQMDEEYRRSSSRDDRLPVRSSPSRSYRHDRDHDNLERDRHRDSRDRDRQRDTGRSRPDDRGRDRRNDERDRDRDHDRERRGTDQGRHPYDRNSSRESGHLYDRRSKERSPGVLYPGQSKYPELYQEPVVKPPPVALPPKPLKSILKKSTPVEPQSGSEKFPSGTPDPYNKDSVFGRTDIAMQPQVEHPKFTHGLPGMSNYMDIEDEEKFLYGDVGHTQKYDRTSVSPDMTIKDRYSSDPWAQKTMEKDNLRKLTPERQQSSWMGLGKREENVYRDVQSGLQSNTGEFDRLMMQQKLAMNPDVSKEKMDMFSFGETVHRPQQQQPSSHAFMSQSSYESPSVGQSEKTPTTVVDLLSIFTNRSSSSFLQSSNVSSILNEPRVSDTEKPKSANYDPTIENILKSIGFDFEMSKRMQEKGQNKPPEPKPDELQLGINQNASFLEGGLSDDVKTNLLSKKKDEHVVENLIREAKESVSQISKALASRETQATKYINEEAKHNHREKSRRSPERRVIPSVDLEDRDRKRRDSDSLERVTKFPREEPKSHDYHRRSSAEPEFSSSKSTPYTSSTFTDPYTTTAHSDPYKTSTHSDPYKTSTHSDPYKATTHSDPYKTSTHSDPYTKTSHIDPYKSQPDPYGAQRLPTETVPPPSQSMPYSQPYDPRYTAAPMPGQPNVPPPYMHGPPPHYPYGPPPMYPGHVPYSHPPGPNPYAPYHRFPPPNETGFPANVQPPGTEPTQLPPPVNKTPPGRKGNLISVKTFEDKKSPERERVEVKTIELKKSDRRIEEEKKKPPTVKKDMKDSPTSSQNSKKETTTRVVSSTKSESNRTVLPPKSEQKSTKRPASDENKKPKVLTEKEKQKLLKDKESRQRRIQSLEEELKRLRKQQNEIMRKKRRQKDGHKDPILLQNSKLQEEIAIQINKLRKATEETTRILKESGTGDDGPPKSKRSKTEEEIKKVEHKPASQPRKQEKPAEQIKKPQPKPESKEKPVKYEFFDPGGHWCRSCNVIAGNVFNYFSHLQGKKHQKSISIYDRPWMTDPGKPEEKSEHVKVVPIKGAEFMMPASAFYCTLCKEFSGDDMCAETHLKSKRHYEKYVKYLEEHQFYEQRLKLDKAAGSSIRKEEDDNSQKEDKYKKEKVTESKSQEKSLSQKQDTEPEKKSESQAKVATKVVEKDKDTGKVSDKKEVLADQSKLKLKITSGNKESDKGKDDGKTSPEAEAKGKIAIHISNKTGIKPVKKIPPRKSALLPPWTPVSKQQQAPIPSNAPPKKSEEKPASLDTFLTIGDKSKPLPVMKESKLLFPNKKIVTAKDILEAFSGKSKEANKSNQSNEKVTPEISQEKKDELKILGIEPESANLLAIPIPPPPRSQNMSLPDDKSLATSSAKDMYNVFYKDADNGGKSGVTDANSLDSSTKDTEKPVVEAAESSEKEGEKAAGEFAAEKESVLSVSEVQSTENANKSEPDESSKHEQCENREKTQSETEIVSGNADKKPTVEPTESVEKIESETVMPSDNIDKTGVAAINIIEPESANQTVEPLEKLVKAVDTVVDMPVEITNVEKMDISENDSENVDKIDVDNGITVITSDNSEINDGGAITICENNQEVKIDIVEDVKSATNGSVQIDNSHGSESSEVTSVSNIKIDVITQDTGNDNKNSSNVCDINNDVVCQEISDQVKESNSVDDLFQVSENLVQDGDVNSNKEDVLKDIDSFTINEVAEPSLKEPEELQLSQNGVGSDLKSEKEVISEMKNDDENTDVKFEIINQTDNEMNSDSDSGTVDYDVTEQDIEEEIVECEAENKEVLEESRNLESLKSVEQELVKQQTVTSEGDLCQNLENIEPEKGVEQPQTEESENHVCDAQESLNFADEAVKLQQTVESESESCQNLQNIEHEEQPVEVQEAAKSGSGSSEKSEDIQPESLSGTSESITMENSDKFIGVTIGDILKPGNDGIPDVEASLEMSENSDNLIKQVCLNVSANVGPNVEIENVNENTVNEIEKNDVRFSDNTEIDKFSDLFEENSQLALTEGGFSSEMMGTATLDELEKTITFDDLFSDQGDSLLSINSDIINQKIINDTNVTETETINVDNLGNIDETASENPVLDEVNVEEGHQVEDIGENPILEEVSDEEDIEEKAGESHMELDEISNVDESEYIKTEKVNLEEVISDVSDGEGDEDHMTCDNHKLNADERQLIESVRIDWPDGGMNCHIPGCKTKVYKNLRLYMRLHWKKVHIPIYTGYVCKFCKKKQYFVREVAYKKHLSKQHRITKQKLPSILNETKVQEANKRYVPTQGIPPPKMASGSQKKSIPKLPVSNFLICGETDNKTTTEDDAESVHSGISMEMGSDFEVVDECVDDDEDGDQEEET